MKRKILSLLLAFSVLFALAPVPAMAVDGDSDALSRAAEAISSGVPSPTVAAVGGEWALIGLVRSGVPVSETFFEDYYRAAAAFLMRPSAEPSPSDVSRIVLALSAAGYDAQNILGQDLTLALTDAEAISAKGLYATVFALLALDCRDFSWSEADLDRANAAKSTYAFHLLAAEALGGGFAFFGDTADADATAMALQALAPYRAQTVVARACDDALAFLAGAQTTEGGLESFGAANTDSTAQALIALAAHGILPDDERFSKNGRTFLDFLLAMQGADGGFSHSKEPFSLNQMSSEQALLSLAAVQRLSTGQTPLYQMGDVAAKAAPDLSSFSFEPREDVAVPAALSAGKTFTDISAHEEKQWIEALASRGIVNGKSEALFDPTGFVTRAEFAAIVTRSLGLFSEAAATFSDVSPDDWFFEPVATAHAFGLIEGTGGGAFSPNARILVQDAAVILARAGRLLGLPNLLPPTRIDAVLSAAAVEGAVDAYANASVAYCLELAVLTADAPSPKTALTRAGAASMTGRLLDQSGQLT